MHNKIKVLYIAGCGRTGSTLLGNALGQIGGFLHVGELREIWHNLVPGRPPCGCKTPVFACDMWKHVLDEAYGGVRQAPISQMLPFLMSNTTVPAFWSAAFPWRARTLQRRLAEPLGALARLYRAIQKVSNCQIIVDSSKRPMYMHKLLLMEAIDLHVIHLVRDPRSWAHAFLKRVAREGYVLHSKPFNSSVEWNRKNWSFEILSKQLQRRPILLRYEDFVANPRASLQSILDFIGATSVALPLHDEHTLNLEAQHTVSGNPNRFKTGKIDVREDRRVGNANEDARQDVGECYDLAPSRQIRIPDSSRQTGRWRESVEHLQTTTHIGSREFARG